jgi:hypothetical protein
VWRNEDTGAKIRQQKTKEGKVKMAEYMDVKSMRSCEIRAFPCHQVLSIGRFDTQSQDDC